MWDWPYLLVIRIKIFRWGIGETNHEVYFCYGYLDITADRHIDSATYRWLDRTENRDMERYCVDCWWATTNRKPAASRLPRVLSVYTPMVDSELVYFVSPQEFHRCYKQFQLITEGSYLLTFRHPPYYVMSQGAWSASPADIDHTISVFSCKTFYYGPVGDYSLSTPRVGSEKSAGVLLYFISNEKRIVFRLPGNWELMFWGISFCTSISWDITGKECMVLEILMLGGVVLYWFEGKESGCVLTVFFRG